MPEKLILAALLALALVSPPAHAQPHDPTKAQALFEQARAAVERNDYAVACEKFRKSDEIDPALGTKLNLANCEEQLGQLAAAWTLLGRVLDAMPKDDPRRPYTEQRIHGLDARVSHLKLIAAPGAPPAMRVRVADTTFDSATLGRTVALDPGEYRVEIETPGAPVRSVTVQLQPAQVMELVVPPEAAGSRSESVPNASDAGTASRSTGIDDRTRIAFIAGGIGAAGLIVGSITGLVGLHQESIGNANCSDVTRTCNQRGFDANATARTMATVSTISLVVGALGLGAGGYFYLTAGSDHDAQLRQARQVSVAYRGSW